MLLRLQLTTAALVASGFQAERQNKYLRPSASLEFTLRTSKSKVHLLDKCRQKRQTAVYEQFGAISDKEPSKCLIWPKA